MRKKIGLAKIMYAALASVMLAALLPVTAVGAASSADGSCQSAKLSVALAADQPTNQTIAATYCRPLVWAKGAHEVDVLTPGATYNRTYWDWPQNSSLYSYVDKTLAAGRATFDYDRMGSGGSSHPLSASITLESDAYVLHQIISWLHGQGFAQANSEGHSYGSLVAMQEAGTYNDESRLIITGLLHIPAPGLAKAADFFYPAMLNPHFLGQKLDPGYLSGIPGTRGLFYDTSSADPSVIAYDNAHPDTVTTTGFATAVATLESLPGFSITDKITAPVLLIDGQEDVFFCSPPQIVSCANPTAIRAYEAPYYASVASLSAVTIPNTGHDLALHPSANTSFSNINTWINSH